MKHFIYIKKEHNNYILINDDNPIVCNFPIICLYGKWVLRALK